MNKQTNTRAAKGGQTGINGDFYEGGQFLPSSPTTVKGEMTRKKTIAKSRKEEIANYKWELQPTPEHRSLWSLCGVGASSTFIQTGYSKETGSQGTLNLNMNMNWTNVCKSPKKEQEKTQRYIDLWNSGERWVIPE